jgi:uncharacterized protein with HEPN domain
MDRDISLINDILESALRIQDKTKNIEFADFEMNLDIQDIVIRRFAIIGEAVGRLSEEFKRHHPKLPYKEMKAMRNVLIHEYDYVSNMILWTTINDDIPFVIESCTKILEDYNRD